MPIQSCRKNGKPGYRWGTSGTCYVYTAGDSQSRKRAKQRALLQSRAIHASQARKKK